MTGQVFLFSTVQSACIEGVLFGVAASSLIELYDRVLDSVVTPFFRSSYVILIHNAIVSNFRIGMHIRYCSCSK